MVAFDQYSAAVSHAHGFRGLTNDGALLVRPHQLIGGASWRRLLDATNSQAGTAHNGSIGQKGIAALTLLGVGCRLCC